MSLSVLGPLSDTTTKAIELSGVVLLIQTPAQ